MRNSFVKTLFTLFALLYSAESYAQTLPKSLELNVENLPNAYDYQAPSVIEPYEEPVTLESDKPITINTSQEISADSFGILTSANGALPLSTWGDSQSNEIIQHLKTLPNGMPSASMHQLLLRLLLSPAFVTTDAPNQNGILHARVNALSMLGRSDQVFNLLRELPERLFTESLRTSYITALLLTGDQVKACLEVKRHASQYDSLSWRKLIIFCQALNKEFAKARLTLAIMQEQNLQVDPFFITLVDSLEGYKVKSPTPPNQLTPLDYAFYVYSGRYQLFNIDALDTLPLNVIQFLAMHDGVPVELRKAALIRAQQFQLVSNEPLVLDSNAVQTTLSNVANMIKNGEVGSVPLLADVSALSLVERKQIIRLYTLAPLFNISVPDANHNAVKNILLRYNVNLPTQSAYNALIESNNVGMAILLAIKLLGQDGLAFASDQTILRIMGALRVHGLDKEARMLAAEAITASYE